MVRVAICDDEAYMCDVLKQKTALQLKELAGTFEITCFTNANELLESQLNYDIYFLDIQMPELNGMEIAKRLTELDGPMAIIFVTVLKEQVFDAFLVEAVDYILKPVEDSRLYSALARALKRLKGKNDKSILVQTINWSKSIKLNSIYYCEVVNRKVYIYTKTETVEYYSKLEEVEKQLDYRFVRCHRSYIVNLDFLSCYESGQITLENGSCVPVSRSRQREFLKLMLQYMKKSEV